MPLVRPHLLAHLLAAADESTAQVTVPEWNGKPQVLPSVYKRSATETVRRALDAGERSLHGFLERIQPHVVPESQVLEFDPEGRSFFNINTRDDLKAAERTLSERS